MNKRERKSVLRYDPSWEHNKENAFKNNSSKSKLKQNNRVAEKKKLKDENLRLEYEQKTELKAEIIRTKDIKTAHKAAIQKKNNAKTQLKPENLQKKKTNK